MNDEQEQAETTHDIKQILSPNFTFTKRQLGIMLLTIGVLGFLGILGLDIAPCRPKRIMLIEKVIFAFPLNQAIGVIHPILWR